MRVVPITTLFLALFLTTIAIAETVQVGTTYYDFQGYGGMSRTITADSLGNIGVVWMNARATSADRVVSYNYRNPAGQWLNNSGIPIGGLSSGYVAIASRPNGNRVTAFHSPTTRYGYSTVLGFELSDSSHLYQTIDIQPPTGIQPLWPRMVIDRQNGIHVFAIERDTNTASGSFKRILYSRMMASDSSPSQFIVAETTFTMGVTVAASRISNRVAMVWPRTLIRSGYGANSYYIADGLNNELMLVQSLNGGVSWNFSNPRNVTRTTVAKVRADSTFDEGDIYRFNSDAAMIFDHNDNLHIAFDTHGIWEDPLADTTGSGSPYSGYTPMANYLWHWTETRPDSFDIVADGWWSIPSDRYHSTVHHPSLAIDRNNNLYCVFTRYGNQEIGGFGYAVGDIWATVSLDHGDNWYQATNLTNTPGNGGIVGSLHSEVDAQVAEVAWRDSLFIQYIDDRGDGCALFNPMLMNTYTLNQVYVKIVPTSDVRRDTLLNPANYPRLRNFTTTGVSDPVAALPTHSSLHPIYPNPFNATATIRYELPKSGRVNLAVHDLSGRLVTTLVDGNQDAGEHRAIFDDAKCSSGAYFVRMETGGVVLTRKMVLMK